MMVIRRDFLMRKLLCSFFIFASLNAFAEQACLKNTIEHVDTLQMNTSKYFHFCIYERTCGEIKSASLTKKGDLDLTDLEENNRFVKAHGIIKSTNEECPKDKDEIYNSIINAGDKTGDVVELTPANVTVHSKESPFGKVSYKWDSNIYSLESKDPKFKKQTKMCYGMANVLLAEKEKVARPEVRIAKTFLSCHASKNCNEIDANTCAIDKSVTSVFEKYSKQVYENNKKKSSGGIVK